MGEVFANPLTELAEYIDMKQALDKGKGPIQASGVTDSQKVHVMHELSSGRAWKLVITYDDTRARELYEDFTYFEKNSWLYPARDLLFYSSDIHGNLLTRERLQVFRHLLEDEGGVVVTTVDGLMDHLLPLSMLHEACLSIEAGMPLDIEEIKGYIKDICDKMVEDGYDFSQGTMIIKRDVKEAFTQQYGKSILPIPKLIPLIAKTVPDYIIKPEDEEQKQEQENESKQPSKATKNH